MPKKFDFNSLYMKSLFYIGALLNLSCDLIPATNYARYEMKEEIYLNTRLVVSSIDFYKNDKIWKKHLKKCIKDIDFYINNWEDVAKVIWLFEKLARV